MNPSFKNLLAFLVLMEGEAILTKSPDYIWEKFDRYVNAKRSDAYLWGMDADNTKLFMAYLEQWDGKRQRVTPSS